MELLVREAIEGYVASKYERLYEKKLLSILAEKGVEIVKVVKSYVGGDEGDEEFVFQFSVFVRNDSEGIRDFLNESLGLLYKGIEDGCSVYTLSLTGYFGDADVLKEDCELFLEILGEEDDMELLEDTCNHFSKQLPNEVLEVLVL